MPKENSTIGDKDIKDALIRSGYLIEYRSETLLRQRQYWVQPNMVYPDPETGKSRELDLRGVKKFRADPKGWEFVCCDILIECVNNPQPIAFLSRTTEEKILYRDDVKIAGYPVVIQSKWSGNEWEPLQSYLDFQDFHHYCHGSVATQFCSFTWKKNSGPWMASHEDAHFASFQKLCAAVEYVTDKHYKSLAFDGDDPVDIRIYYPVLVVKGKILEVCPTEGPLDIKETNHAQYRILSISGSTEITYQIDVVTERAFPEYLDLIEQEVKEAALRLHTDTGEVQQSLAKIVEKVRSAGLLNSPVSLRDVLTKGPADDL